MNKYAKTQALLLALFIVFAYAQTADDDEVDVSIPGYPHKFYSGNQYVIKVISCSVSLQNQKPFITPFSPHKVISRMIL